MPSGVVFQLTENFIPVLFVKFRHLETEGVQVGMFCAKLASIFFQLAQ